MKKVIVVPTYNESKNIAELVPLLFRHVPDAFVLVVDDNSPDGTSKVVDSMQDKYPNLLLLKRQGKEGLGKAYIHAFKEVLKDKSVDIIIMMDADFSHDPKYLPEMLRRIGTSDVMLGSRYTKGGSTEGWELWRRFLSKGGNLYCRMITGMPINDCTGGFNVMKASLMRKVDFDRLDLSGYAFIMELKYAFHKAGAKFSEYPIIFKNRREGESKMTGHIIGEGVIAPWKMRLKSNRPSVVKESKSDLVTSYSEPLIKMEQAKTAASIPVTKPNSLKTIDYKCLACEGAIHKPYAMKNGYDVFQCQSCKMLFLYPVPLPQASAAVYGKEYFAGANKGFGYVDYDIDKEAMRPVFTKHLAHFESLLGKPGKMLDIGAATGFFMKIAKQRGWEVHGVEISDYAADKARKSGLNVVTGILDNCKFKNESFDLITMWDVVEHMSDPTKDIVHANTLLKKGGLLAINTPDSGSLYAKTMKSKWHLFVPPEHIWYFNRESIAKLLGKNNFKVMEIGCIGKSFTVEYVVSFLYRWQKLSIWKKLSKKLENGRIGKLSVPINLRDNMYILAKKV